MVEEQYEIVLTKQALKDLKKVKAAGLSKKVYGLLEILSQDPFREYPFYEPLKGDLKNHYSRRINVQHRLVYSVNRKNRVVKIHRMWTHYE